MASLTSQWRKQSDSNGNQSINVRERHDDVYLSNEAKSRTEEVNRSQESYLLIITLRQSRTNSKITVVPTEISPSKMELLMKYE